ncbi:MAG: hypoxanthine phosphoribosyltransferase [Cyanobacteria bacterium REEB65]|nr:hypoxanthine phosphoribosyltransferase [Cyanobacteria bacterium REEB65]
MPQTAPAVHPDVAKILLDEAALNARIKEMGAQISRDYKGRDLLLVGILRGSIVFMGELMKALSIDCAIDFMNVTSYAGTKSTGEVRVLLDLREGIEGKDVVIVEDIVDTGLTLSHLMAMLKTRGPRSLEIAALLDKPVCRKTPVKAKYTGFEIPNEFVVGFGLDFNEKYRNLPYVGVLKPRASRP